MKINFNEIPTQCLPNFKGGDLHYDAKMYTDELNKIMLGLLVPGASIGLHTHTDNSEIIYVLSGEGTAICDGKEESLSQGDCHYCPKGSAHTLKNTGNEDLRFFAVVSNVFTKAE